MTKIDNYILLSIAEKVYEVFKKTNYMTYSGFCRKLSLAINSKNTTQKEKYMLCEIIDELTLIYNLNDADAWKYIDAFFKFDVETFGEYFSYIKSMESTYPLLFIDK
jgi:hypothetical protein